MEKGLYVAMKSQQKIVSEMERAWIDYHVSHQRIALFQLVQARRGLGVTDPRYVSIYILICYFLLWELKAWDLFQEPS